MRGGFLHELLLQPIVRRFTQTPGARVHHEYAAGPTIHHGAVDLFIEYLHHRIVVEAERTPRRVLWDIEKALSLDASHLLIVTPSAQTARALRRRIIAAGPMPVPDKLWVYPFGPALVRLESLIPAQESSPPLPREASS